MTATARSGEPSLCVVFDDVIVEAAREVFGTSAGCQVVEVVFEGDRADRGDIFAVISFGSSRPGMMVMGCTVAVATALAGGMLGIGPGDLDEEMVRDALGELVNQIAGTVKRKLAASRAEVMLGVPMVVSGASLDIKVLADVEPRAVTLRSDVGTIGVRVWWPAGAA